MKKNISLTFTFVLLSWWLSLIAQETYLGTPKVTHFTRIDYEAGTQNWYIGQDTRGIMYFGNNKGLLEFDGSSWSTHRLPNYTIVRSFYLSSDGRIYVGGQSEFGYFQPNSSGALTYNSLLHLLPNTTKMFEDVWKTYQINDHFFFCTEKAIFRYSGDSLTKIPPIGKRFENFFVVDNQLYIQDEQKGLFQLAGNAFRSVPGSNSLIGKRIVAMLSRSDKHHLVITESDGIFRMDNNEMVLWKSPASDFSEKFQAYCAVNLAQGGFAIGTAQYGLIIANEQGFISLHLKKGDGLNNNTVLSVFEDAQENVWMGLDNGISYAQIQSPFTIIGDASGVNGTGYSAIIEKGDLYLGTNQGLYKCPWNTKVLTQKPLFSTVSIGQVWNMNRVSNGVILSQHKGASLLNDNITIPISSVQGSWKFKELEQHPGYALEGTYNGFVVYRKDANSKWKQIGIIQGFRESARVFEEDALGNVWVSHAYKGLFKLTFSENMERIEQIATFTHEQGLPQELFINVAKIRNELVFTSPKGIFRYNNLSNRFDEHPGFTEIFGPGRQFHRILEDEKGNIWFSIDNEFGLLRIKDKGISNTFDIYYFNQFQEALVDGFEHVYAHDANNIFIGTETGFIHFDPKKQTDIEFPFDLIIRRVALITQGDSTVLRNVDDAYDADSNKFDYYLNDFRFEFTAPFFQENNHLEYRFKLEGFDKDWSVWTSRTQKEYTNLSHGTYKFTVQARNAFGKLSKEASYTFQIRPPWYLTIYAKIAYFIMGLIVFTIVFIGIARREEVKTEAFKQEQLKKLELKEAEFKKEVEKSEGELINLRNEKLQADVMHKTSQLAASTMHLVQKSEILTKLKSDLHQLSDEAPAELKRRINQISRAIDSDIQLDNTWDQFEVYFDQVHENFFKRLRQKFPDLTPKDQKLCAYLRMNLSSKEIAPLLNISVRGVEISRYRVRKKLNIDSDINLVAFIMDI